MIAAPRFRSSAPRPRVMLALMRRDYLISRSYQFALVFDLVFGVLNVLVYYFISRALHFRDPTRFQGARDYFAFAVVGLATVTVVQSATLSLSRSLREEQLTGTLEALVATPVRPLEMALGIAGFPFGLAVGRAAIYVLVANTLLGLGLSSPSWAGFAIVLLAAGGVMANLGVVLAALVLVVKRSDTLAAVATAGLGILGGGYFPRGVLPGWLQALSTVVPSRFAFDGTRAALFRGHGWEHSALALAVIGALAVPFSTWLFAGSLRLSLRKGSLTGY